MVPVWGSESHSVLVRGEGGVEEEAWPGLIYTGSASDDSTGVAWEVQALRCHQLHLKPVYSQQDLDPACRKIKLLGHATLETNSGCN